MVTLGSLKVNSDCDTIPQLSNYSTKYFLHFSDDKCKTIHDILKKHTQFSQKKYSVTFTSKNLPTPAKHKITTNYYAIIYSIYILPVYNSCKIWHASWYTLFLGPAETIPEQCFSKQVLQVQKCLAHQLFLLL